MAFWSVRSDQISFKEFWSITMSLSSLVRFLKVTFFHEVNLFADPIQPNIKKVRNAQGIWKPVVVDKGNHPVQVNRNMPVKKVNNPVVDWKNEKKNTPLQHSPKANVNVAMANQNKQFIAANKSPHRAAKPQAAKPHEIKPSVQPANQKKLLPDATQPINKFRSYALTGFLN